MNTREITSSTRLVAIVLCFLTSVFEGYDLQAIGVAVPMIGPELGLTKNQIGMALGATMLGLMLGALAGGWLADRIGRRPALALGVLLFGAATLLTAFCTDIGGLIAARMATGIGIGAAMPNIMAIATDIANENRQTSTAMLMFCGLPVGAAGVALLAGSTADLHWQTLFIVGGLLPMLLAPVILWAMPETSPSASSANENRSGVWTALAGDGRGWITLNLWVAYALTLVVLYLLLSWLPDLIVGKGFGPSDGAIAALAFNIGSIVGALLLGHVVDRAGLRWPMVCVFAVLVCSFVGLSNAVAMTQIAVFCGMAGACVVGSQFVLYGITPGLYPHDARGFGSGAAVAAGRLGAIAGPVGAGILLQGGMTSDEVVLAISPVVVVAGLAVFVLSLLMPAPPASSGT